MSAERYEQIVALGRDPISADSPVGDSCRYDDLFTQLASQMEKIGSLTGEAVDWRQVTQTSTEILKSKSKDMLVMTYLTLGVFETEGYAALHAAFDAYREFLTKFWEACYPKPKPPQGRFNAIQYMIEKILDKVELRGGQAKRNPTAAEKEAVHKCADAIAALDSAVTTAFSGAPDTPNMLPLVRSFKALKEKVGPLVSEQPAAAAAPTQAPAGGESPAASSVGGGASAPAMAGGAEGIRNETQAFQQIRLLAKYFLTQDNKNPVAYRLMRVAQFGGLARAPDPKLLPPIPNAATRKGYLDKLAGEGNWPQLLTEAEGQFGTSPFWLDLQRYVALALKNMGPMYAPAASAVAMETVALQSRLPDMFELSFKDNTPFADGATKSWLEECTAQFGGGGGGSGASSNGDAVSAALAEARKLLGEAKGPEAVARLSNQAGSSAGRRERFRAQLALAEIFLDLGKPALALSLLEGLEAAIAEYRVEDWEPDLAAKAFQNLYVSMSRKLGTTKPTPDETRRLDELFAKLCRLDPETALKLEAAKK